MDEAKEEPKKCEHKNIGTDEHMYFVSYAVCMDCGERLHHLEGPNQPLGAANG